MERQSDGESLWGRLPLLVGLVGLVPGLTLALWLAVSYPDHASAVLFRGVAIALLAAFLGLFLSQEARRGSERDLRAILRAARRLSTGNFAPVPQAQSSSILGYLSNELDKIGIAMEGMQSALDSLETESDFQIGKRSKEIVSLLSETERLRKDTELLNSFAQAINQTLDPIQICLQIFVHAQKTMSYTWAAAYLFDNPPEGPRRLVPVYLSDVDRSLNQIGHHLRDLPELADLGEKSLAAWVVQHRRKLRLGERRDESWSKQIREGLSSMLVVPLLLGDQVHGAIEIGSSEIQAFGEHEERFITTLAIQASIAIENARLLEEAAKVEALRELDKAKTEILASVSHELKTPLSCIMGYSESLLLPGREWDEDEARESLQIINDESKRLNYLIQDLLDMSRIAAGRLNLTRHACHLGPLARKVARRARIQSPAHKLQTHFPRNLPPADAEQCRIEQVIENLISNAVKYSPEGGRVRVRGMLGTIAPNGRIDLASPQPDSLIVAVADEGLGIHADQIGQIFDRFFRVGGEACENIKGHGLGLAISRGIVEAHGGALWVESPPRLVRAGETGKGSTFYFSLPIRDPALDADDDDLAEPYIYPPEPMPVGRSLDGTELIDNDEDWLDAETDLDAILMGVIDD